MRSTLALLPVLLLTSLLAVLLCVPPDRALAAARQSPADRLAAEFSALEKDAKKGGRRDLWLGLEKKCADVAAKSKGEDAARAALYRARAWQELGNRSYLASDHKEAVKFFGVVADKYGNYKAAPESLLRQATVQADKLGDGAGAEKTLNRLIRSYPKAPEAATAKQRLASGGGAARADAAGAAQIAGTGSAAPVTDGKDASVTLKKITWKGKPQRAVVTLELNDGADFSYNFLPPDPAKKTPGRLYLDIAGAFPGSGVKAGVTPKNLVVSRIRTSRSGEGTRVTLECDGLRCYAVRVPDNAPGTIEIEISRAEDIKGGVSVGTGKPGSQKGGQGTSQGSSQASSGAAPAKPVSVMDQLGLTVKTIMLDAGHGGKDPGAMAGGIVERQFTLAMARRVGALLEKKGFTVLYTRTGNTYISLQDRPDIANNKKADLFISFHVNANNNAAVHGLETYYLDEAKTQDAAVVAARENAVSVKNISDLQFILTDLMLSYKVKESRHLALCVHRGILKKLRASKLSSHDNGVRSAPFYVLMGARMPAILVEFGYITNKGDLASLKSDAYLQRQAEGLVEGILQYQAELAKMVP